MTKESKNINQIFDIFEALNYELSIRFSDKEKLMNEIDNINDTQ